MNQIFWRDTQKLQVVEEGEYREGVPVIKMNFGKDRFLFRKSQTVLQEYIIESHSVKLISEFDDPKFLIDDFGFYKLKEKKGEENQIIMVSQRGVLKRIAEKGASRKFEIEPGTPR